MRILLLEDSEEMAKMLLEWLKDFKHEVTWYIDPKQFYTDTKSSKDYDFIITDNRMPNIMGIEFLRQLRKNGDETPAVMHSADVNNDLRSEVQGPLKSGFVTKLDFDNLEFELKRRV